MTASSAGRPRPSISSCMSPNSSACATNHPHWRHATSIVEIEEFLDQDVWVADRDGDTVEKIEAYKNKHDSSIECRVTLEGGGRYEYPINSILLEDVVLVQPASDEEVDEAMASILAAFKANRIT